MDKLLADRLTSAALPSLASPPARTRLADLSSTRGSEPCELRCSLLASEVQVTSPCSTSDAKITISLRSLAQEELQRHLHPQHRLTARSPWLALLGCLRPVGQYLLPPPWEPLLAFSPANLDLYTGQHQQEQLRTFRLLCPPVRSLCEKFLNLFC